MTEEEILDKIDKWHELPVDNPRTIYEYLGWTWPEYKAWAEGHARDKTRQAGGYTED